MIWIGRTKNSAMALAGACGLLLLANCSETGPVYPTSSDIQPWVMAAESRDPAADRAPKFDNPVVHFALAPGERRSSLHTGRRWTTDMNYLMGFDVRVRPETLPRDRVTIGRLVRRGPTEEELLRVVLDPSRGVTVLGRTCIPRAKLHQWHSVEVRTRFADDDTGFMEVWCDRRPLWAQSHYRTTLPPTCRRSEGCTMPLKGAASFDWQFGLISPRPAPRPISIEMRRIHTHRLFVIPRRVEEL